MIININGKELGIKFNNRAIEKLGDVKDMGLGFGFITSIVWGGYCGYCFAKQIETYWTDADGKCHGFTFEDISEWVDSSIDNEEIAKQIREIQHEYQESQSYQRLIKRGIEIEKKNSMNTTSTNTSLDSAE